MSRRIVQSARVVYIILDLKCVERPLLFVNYKQRMQGFNSRGDIRGGRWGGRDAIEHCPIIYVTPLYIYILIFTTIY